MSTANTLKISRQAVARLVKEDLYYRSELSEQTERVQKLEEELKSGAAPADGNAEFMIKQEKQAAQETKAVFAPLHERIGEAVERLEERIAAAESEGLPAADIAEAKETLEKGKGVAPPPL